MLKTFEPTLVQNSIIEGPEFVAERRLTLARPFKAGIKKQKFDSSRERRLSDFFNRRSRDDPQVP